MPRVSQTKRQPDLAHRMIRIGALPCDHGLRCSDRMRIWEQRRNVGRGQPVLSSCTSNHGDGTAVGSALKDRFLHYSTRCGYIVRLPYERLDIYTWHIITHHLYEQLHAASDRLPRPCVAVSIVYSYYSYSEFTYCTWYQITSSLHTTKDEYDRNMNNVNLKSVLAVCFYNPQPAVFASR